MKFKALNKYCHKSPVKYMAKLNMKISINCTTQTVTDTNLRALVVYLNAKCKAIDDMVNLGYSKMYIKHLHKIIAVSKSFQLTAFIKRSSERFIPKFRRKKRVVLIFGIAST